MVSQALQQGPVSGALLLPGGRLTAVGQPLQALIQAVCRVHCSVQMLANQCMILHSASWYLQGTCSAQSLFTEPRSRKDIGKL